MTIGLLTPRYFRSERTYVSGLPDLPIATEVPPWIKPNEQIIGQPDMTVGWMLQAKRDGALPSGQQLDTVQRAMLPLQLGVALDPSQAPDGLTCATYDHPIALDPSRRRELDHPPAHPGRTPERRPAGHALAQSRPAGVGDRSARFDHAARPPSSRRTRAR